jgi:PAS domain S-box-containing protein
VDVTSLKALFDHFMDSIDAGVYVLDCDGIIERVNRYILDTYKWEPRELIGRNIFELMPDLHDAGIEGIFRAIIREREVKSLTNLRRPDRFGKEIVYNLKGIPILDGGEVRGVLVVMDDVTERRVLESQVAETEQYLTNLINNANDIIYTLDADGHLTFLNKMGRELLGYELVPEEKAHYTAYVARKDLAKNERHFRSALKGIPQRFASAIIASDGRLVSVLINITPIWKDDEVVGVLGIARDITERKQMEAQLLQASKLAAIGELAAGVAHEINNPVAIISGTAEQLQFLVDRMSKHPDGLDERFSTHLTMIREQAERCKRITQGLLNFARKTEIQVTDVNIIRLVEETVALLENRARAERKTIETHLPTDTPRLSADSHQIEQVFLNLLNNALDAVDAGGTVTIRALTENGSIRIDVTDDGTGISDEALKKIFDPFFTTKPIGKGTGLGLSICFGIVQRMNGTISVNSNPGAGTTFTVRLPLDQPGPPDT